MLIHWIRLENFKSYVNETVHFELGTNAIVGRNGAGKSTLLEAIGFALFDHASATRQSDLLRDGATSGSVVVCFRSSMDDRDYEVERVLGRTGTTRHRVYDPEVGRKVLAESVGEVTLWLRDHLGIESTASLDDLFRNTIGVPQGSFTAPFLLAAGERKRIFDPLLQVDEYDRAFQNLRETNRHLSDETSAIDQEIARLEGLLAQLPSLATERETLEAETVRLAGEARRLQEALTRARAELRRLDEAERELRRTEQAQTEIDHQYRAAQENRDKAQQSVIEAETALEKLTLAEPGYREYLAAEESLTTLEHARVARDQAARELERVRLEHTRVQARQELVQQALDEIEVSARELEALKPQVAVQEELQSALEEARAATQILEEMRRQAAIADRDLAEQTARLTSLDGALQQRLDLEADLAQLKGRLDSLEAQERQLVDDRSTRQASLDRLKEQATLLEKEHGAQCPTCEAGLTPAHREELLVRNTQQTQALVGQLNGTLRQLAEVTRTRTQGRRDQADLERRLQSLPTLGQREQLAEMVATQQTKCTALIERIARSTAGGDRVVGLSRRLADLGDPRSRANVLTSRVLEQDARARELLQLTAKAQKMATEANRWLDQLAQYAHLDEDIASVRQILTRCRGDHDLYLTQRDTAGQLDRRRELLSGLALIVSDLIIRLETVSEECRRAAEGYDRSRHDALRQQVEETNGAHVQASTRLNAQRERLSVVASQIERLEAQQERLATQQEERETLRRLADTLEEMRSLLRAAGPYVTRQLVANISMQASSFYNDIMNDYSGRLAWSEDYDLSLEVKGHSRSFQQLSGGEQMSAALALRLALLRQLSSINVAFFDEPTAHLDPERRDGLAEKIMEVKGFHQLFVISHDDTFERVAQNYIRVVKENDVSMIQVS